MMPRANTESLSKAPPENMLKTPKMVPSIFAKNEAKASASIPGVGTCTPILYTKRRASVYKIRFLSSGILKIFPNPLPTMIR